MATWADVDRLCLALPQVVASTSWGRPAWKVKDRVFIWDRPLTGVEVRQLGEAAPDVDLLGAYVADEGVKQALVAAEPEVFLTTPHFDGYAVVLARLHALELDGLEELVIDSWLLRAPAGVRRAHPEVGAGAGQPHAGGPAARGQRSTSRPSTT